MGINYAKGPFIIGMFYTRRCLQNGYISKSRTHTSGHFDIGVHDPPPPSRAPVYGNVRHSLFQSSLFLSTYCSLLISQLVRFFSLHLVHKRGHQRKQFWGFIQFFKQSKVLIARYSLLTDRIVNIQICHLAKTTTNNVFAMIGRPGDNYPE